ncbi:MAG: hypothetical protein QOK10_1158 [Pseudonocardiales bacterium]|nr:hypothetical protein [Pseudonocardiales bacterium]
MHDKICFVQFLHPGGEHRPSGDFMPWNVDDHRRKFLVAPGVAQGHQDHHQGDLVFWAE